MRGDTRMAAVVTGSRISGPTGREHFEPVFIRCARKARGSCRLKTKAAKLKAIFSYSHRDTEKLERLKTHSAMLVREGRMTLWHDRDINGGTPLDREIAERLSDCEFFLPLLSPDYLSSGYCYNREMRHAIARHRKGELRVVPVILEPCDWRSSPLGRFKALPRDGKPISTWDNENEAMLDVVTELRRLIKAPRAVGHAPRRPARASARDRAARRPRRA